MAYKHVIYGNCVTQMKVIVHAASKLGIEMASEDNAVRVSSSSSTSTIHLRSWPFDCHSMPNMDYCVSNTRDESSITYHCMALVCGVECPHRSGPSDWRSCRRAATASRRRWHRTSPPCGPTRASAPPTSSATKPTSSTTQPPSSCLPCPGFRVSCVVCVVLRRETFLTTDVFVGSFFDNIGRFEQADYCPTERVRRHPLRSLVRSLSSLLSTV